MKNIIFNYNEYKNDIFKGDGLQIESAFFSGFRFFEDDKYIAYITFQLVTNENKIVVLNYSLKFEDELDYTEFKNMYIDLPVSGVSTSIMIPSLLQISCFYKIDPDVFLLYARHIVKDKNSSKVVYKLHFSKQSFLYIMQFLNNLRMYNIIDYCSFIETNNFTDHKNIKITSEYHPIIRAVCFSSITKYKLFKKKYFGWYAVTLKDNHDNHLRLIIPTFEFTDSLKMHNLDPDKAMTSSSKFYEYINSLEKEDILLCSDIIETEFSISANQPMTYYTYISSINNKVVFIDMSPEVYNKIDLAYKEFLKKK